MIFGVNLNKLIFFVAISLIMMVMISPVNAGEDWNLNRLLTGLAVKKNTQVRFVEEKHFSFMEKKLTSSGILYYQYPDVLIREILEPEKQRYVVNGMHLIMEQGGWKRSIDISEYPQIRVFVDTFRATLAGDIKTIHQLFVAQLSGNQESWTLSFSPRNKDLSDQVEKIVLKGEVGRLWSIETREHNGDYSIMHLKYDDN
jgi:hypothetical protein